MVICISSGAHIPETRCSILTKKETPYRFVTSLGDYNTAILRLWDTLLYSMVLAIQS